MVGFLPHTHIDPVTDPCSRRGRFRRTHGEAAEEAAPSEGAGLAIPRLAYYVWWDGIRIEKWRGSSVGWLYAYTKAQQPEPHIRSRYITIQKTT